LVEQIKGGCLLYVKGLNILVSIFINFVYFGLYFSEMFKRFLIFVNGGQFDHFSRCHLNSQRKVNKYYFIVFLF